MMRRSLPPFPALQSFEAAARLGSFSRAADELCVTQSAVSHRIRDLEDFLGVKLFRRLTRKIVLTPAGEGYLADLGDVFDRLHAATLNLRDSELAGSLSLLGTPGFVSRWLLPRLSAFTARHPGIELHVSTGVVAGDEVIDDVDVMVVWGDEQRPGFRVDPFLDTTCFPVASPALLGQSPPLCSPSDLLGFVILHEEVDDEWPRWFEFAGVRNAAAATAGPRFAHCDLALQAAIEGQGVALAYAKLAESQLKSGQLSRCCEVELPARRIYSLVSDERTASRPRVAAFRKWLLAEGARPSQ